MSNVAEADEEHSIIWGMFMAATMNAATFMGKNFLDNQNSIKNSADITLKNMFDITEKLVCEQEIVGVDKINWEKHIWKQLSLIGDETVINLQRAKVYVFSDSVLCLGKIHQHPESNEAWKRRIEWTITDQSYRDYDGINGDPTGKVVQHPECNEAWKNRVAGVRAERSYRDYDAINGESTKFEWNIFPGLTTLQLCGKVTDLLSSLGETPETFTGRILQCSTTFPVTVKAIKKNVWQMLKSSAYLQRSLVLDSGHLLVQVPKRNGILWKRIVHKEFGIVSRSKCCWNSLKADVLFSVQQLHCPGVISKAKDTENCRYILLLIRTRLGQFFA